MKTLNKLWKDESGATAIEYGLIAALVGVVLIIALRFLGSELSKTFNTVGNELSKARSKVDGQ